MKTIKSFAAQSNIPSSLIRAVVRQIGGWTEFKECASDIYNHGADAGVSGFIYYTETEAFTKRNKVAILEMAKQQADDMGSESMIAMIAGFNCLGMTTEEVAEALYNARSDNRTQVYNALAWYALEEVARNYGDITEQY